MNSNQWSLGGAVGMVVTMGMAGCGADEAPTPAGIGLVGQACHRTELYTPPANPGALAQIRSLHAARDHANARSIRKMVETPQAVWLTQGTADSVRRDVHRVVKRANGHGTPVLVAYNLPFRDCAQYSAGGATTAAEYAEWIDGFAAGIGDSPAIVILEPDGLGIIPYFVPYYATDYEWCQPPEADPATAANERFAMLNAAVDRLNQQPNVSVYLDGTHAAWLGVGEAAHRLDLAGVERAAGFFLNVSNYRTTSDSVHFGRWVSSCLALTQGISWWDASWCPGQYVQDPETGAYYADYSDATVAAVEAAFASNLADNTPEPLLPATSYVIDTSRNGQGPWTAPADHPEGDPQDWCNPPARGLGLRPTLLTDLPLVDAYLWVKIPGESDGQCTRWDPASGQDPVRGLADPAAGEWFPDMALELAHNAEPALTRR
ncbi:MAG: glycoside hydrolase family 6 protein [Polyangiaceae bacterium]|nr:glycoside hydrolase family 6 protein [Polyangiaceae bacterium]